MTAVYGAAILAAALFEPSDLHVFVSRMKAAEAPARTWGRFRRTAFSAGSYDPRRPVAMFDFDSTLRPYRGRGPPEELTRDFLALLSSSFNLVIVSNRSTDSAAALAPLQTYVSHLDKVAECRVTVYAPSARDRERKPHTGTWEHYKETLCAGKNPGFRFFCGDAAGRPGTTQLRITCSP
jgi:hypothetical protein